MSQAERALRERLQRDPNDFDALNDLAHRLYTTGSGEEAYALYAEAVRCHPERAMAHANLAFLLVRAGELEQARVHYERALEIEPGNEQARRGLLVVTAQLGETDRLAALQSAGRPVAATVTLPYRGKGTPVELLALVTLGTGNIATDALFDDRVFRTTKLAVELFDESQPLPPHHVAFNTIGDPDSAPAALDIAQRLLAKTEAPVLNRPQRVRLSGRIGNSARLTGIEGVRVPAIAAFERSRIAGPEGPAALAAAGFAFPVLLRTPGYHTGQHFTGVSSAQDLAAAAQALPGEAVLAIEYIDTRDARGEYRKYRAMFVNGAVYPLHLAIAANWKVHYLSADMAAREDHRACEATFLNDMPAAIGQLAAGALERVARALDLEYAGADFAVDAQGKLVVFEANPTMAVLVPPPGAQWEYRRSPVKRVLDAVRTMLETHPFPSRNAF